MKNKLSNQKNKGYATVLTMVLFSALGLSMLALFNAGQLTTHKMKLQNAADAAVYSSALVESRKLNYLAYTNRAMVANQVEVGQAIGLASWSRMMLEFRVNLDVLQQLVSLIPYIGAYLSQYIEYFVKLPLQLAEYSLLMFDENSHVVDTFELFVSAQELLIQALTRSQQLVNAAMSGIAITVYYDVLNDNDSGATGGGIASPASLATLLGLVNSTENISSPVDGNADLAEYRNFANMLGDSTDRFTKPAAGSRRDSWLEASLSVIIHEIEEWDIESKGGNEFDERLSGGRYVWEWSALDTVSFFNRTFDLDPTKWEWSKWSETKLGWGAAHSSSLSTYPYVQSGSGSGGFGGYTWGDPLNGKWGNPYNNGGEKGNKKAANSAISDYGDNNKHNMGKSGLQPFYRLRNRDFNITVPFIAGASKNAGGSDGFRPWNAIVNEQPNGKVSDRLDIEDVRNVSGAGGAANQIFVLTKSEAYFLRSIEKNCPATNPACLSNDFSRDDGLIEYANLMNPYWQPRLVNVNAAEKAAVGSIIFAVTTGP